MLDPVMGPLLPLSTTFGFVPLAVWYGGWGTHAAGIVRWVLSGEDITHTWIYFFQYGIEILVADARAKHRIMEFLSSYNVVDEVRSLKFRSQ
jgi:hypothetical protein